MLALLLAAALGSPQRVGPQDEGTRLPTSHLIHPAGDVWTLPGRPVDLAISPDGATVFVKDNTGLRVLDSGWG